jgi:hypothetical protein
MRIRQIPQKTDVGNIRKQRSIQICPPLLLNIKEFQRDRNSINVVNVAKCSTGVHTSLGTRESTLERSHMSVTSVVRPSGRLLN